MSRQIHHSINSLALCLIVICGCGNEDNSSETTSSAATQAAEETKAKEKPRTKPESADQREKLEPLTVTGYESALRFRLLTEQEFPWTVADNGETHNFSTILESLGTGGAAIDFDLDGWPDCAVAGGGDFRGRATSGLPIHLLRNRQTGFLSCTKTAGLENTLHYNHGLSASDFDNDGFPDVLVTGYGGIQLFHNLGDGTFEDVASSRLDCPTWNVSAAWADFNQDGNADLYVVSYVDWSFENDPPCFANDGVTRDNCSPKIFEPLSDFLFLSNGDGTFKNATEEYGVRPDGKGLGVVAADIDLDGDTDVYVGNDVMMNFLYRNENGERFEDISSQCGACVSSRGSPDASMGVDVADFNKDGLPDLWAANFELESFAVYKNQGRMLFRHSSDLTGVSAIGSTYVGWGSAFTDLDLDGDLDVAVCNGHVVKHPEHSPAQQRMILLENIEGNHFEEVASQAGGGLMTPRNGRGLAVTDWNRDGLPDLLITPMNSPSGLLENESPKSGRWLAVNLIGTTSARHAVGAVVRLQTAEGELLRQQKGGGSYASTSTATLMFGVPNDSQIKTLLVRWPSGIEQRIDDVPSNTLISVIEPESNQPQPNRVYAGPN